MRPIAIALRSAVMLGALGCASCSGSTPGAAGAQSGGARPPDFELSTLDGKTVRLSDHLGKDVVLIDFWATFCDPCLASMPHLDEVYKTVFDASYMVMGLGTVYLGAPVDTPLDPGHRVVHTK